ncbi:MAG TPA: metal ABC transporter substrate-binding protein [Phototrophicaceae bacterium]|jgi:zinc/manganese transport system substrate-binding protein|nr:metal ABC transporter substrate-binding protein [Phototrophicaceae bacterium]
MRKKLLRVINWKAFFVSLAFLCVETPVVFAQQIRVVATWPALADITKQIGKELVTVDSLATGVEDPHGVPMKPSFVPRLNRADVLVMIGLEDEHAWLPALLEVASNPKILLNRPGYIDCSVGVPVLEAPSLVDRSEGDLHPKGNPHYLLDPVRAKIAAQNIAAGLARNFPQHQAVFDKNLKAYTSELDNWMERWQKMAGPLQGLKFVEYHPEWIYLADRFGMKRIGSVELKPGIEPTPNHIVDLVQTIKQEKARLLIYGAQNPRVPQQISNETGIKLLRLYSGGGSGPETDSYIKWIDYTVRTLVQAAS